MRMSKWVVLGAALTVVLAAPVAVGKNAAPYYEAYLASGLAQHQVGFGEFRGLLGDAPCTTADPTIGAGSAVIHDDAGSVHPGPSPAIVHDDAGNMEP